MKKALVVLGGVFLTLLILGGVGFGLMAYEGTKFDTSSKAYAEEANARITESWSADELKSRASSALKQAATDAQIDQLFQQLAPLGGLQSPGDFKGESNISYIYPQGARITALYSANETFQNGTAQIDVGLIREQGQWLILSFHAENAHLNTPAAPNLALPAPDAAAPAVPPAAPPAPADSSTDAPSATPPQAPAPPPPPAPVPAAAQ